MLKSTLRRQGRLFWCSEKNLRSAGLRLVNNTHSCDASCTYNLVALESRGCVRGIGCHTAHTSQLYLDLLELSLQIIPTSLQIRASANSYTEMLFLYFITVIISSCSSSIGPWEIFSFSATREILRSAPPGKHQLLLFQLEVMRLKSHCCITLAVYSCLLWV